MQLGETVKTMELQEKTEKDMNLKKENEELEEELKKVISEKMVNAA